ncbi:MAG: hypothetical protein R2856_30890 [Caldilineaceae bacterium]
MLRLLLEHPHVTVQQVTSERNAGSFVHFTHPNLRGRTKLQFVSAADLEPCDVLVTGLPHGSAMQRIEEFAALAPRIVDMSADFLRNAGLRHLVRGGAQKPHLARKVRLRAAELHRDQIAGASCEWGWLNAHRHQPGDLAALR